VKTGLDESRLLITVEDSGTGIDPADFDRIFDPFYTTKSHSMGMGLSICRSIIEMHGGRLTVARGEPDGAVFQVSLPSGGIGPGR
jgi:signal transduction histidine kinase